MRKAIVRIRLKNPPCDKYDGRSKRFYKSTGFEVLLEGQKKFKYEYENRKYETDANCLCLVEITNDELQYLNGDAFDGTIRRYFRID